MTLSSEIIESFKNFKTFTFSDVRMVLRNKHNKISDKTIQVTLSRMVRGEKLYTVKKGIFSLEQRDEFVGFAFTPFYYGGLTALMITDLIDDQVKMEIMTTHKIKKSFIDVYKGKSHVEVHHLPKKYYFGFTEMRYGDIIVPVSDPEKTLIDLFYYNKRLFKRNYAELIKHVNMKTLEKYLNCYDKRIKKRIYKFIKIYKSLTKSGILDNSY